MREKNDHKNSAPDNEQRPDDPDRSLSISGEPAPIDIAAFGKKLGEIISKALPSLPALLHETNNA
jgi:hypothetical protein